MEPQSNPLVSLLMAQRGHQGLPPTISTGGPPPAAPGPSEPTQLGQPGGGGDKQIAQGCEQYLTHAMASATDPEFKQILSQALASVHKYLAQDQREQHQALAGKLSPRLMAQQYGR